MSTTKQRALDLLRALLAGKRVPVRLQGEPWADDHILCCNMALLDEAGVQHVVELMWVGWEGVAAVKYAASSLFAYNDLMRLLPAVAEALEEQLAEEQPCLPSKQDDAGAELDHGGVCPN